METYRQSGRPRAISIAAPLIAALALGCGSSDDPAWQLLARDLPGALMSVGGTSASDVFVVGADVNDGRGPTVLHYDGNAWQRLATGQTGNLWWVHSFPGGPTYLGGDGGVILRFDGSGFTRMTTPGTDTVFGIWGVSPDDVWAVGGAAGGSSGGFAWRLQGDTWVDAPGFPSEVGATDAIWKMFGRSATDAWMVGTSGKAVQWNGSTLTPVSTGAGESLFTVHADAERFVAVGGFGTGKILEYDGASWRNVSPQGAPGFIGVCLSPQGDFAVGQEGVVFTRGASGWAAEATGFTVDEQFHSVWVDPSGGVWAVGGQVLTIPLIKGVVAYRGEGVPAIDLEVLR